MMGVSEKDCIIMFWERFILPTFGSVSHVVTPVPVTPKLFTFSAQNVSTGLEFI